MKKILCIAFAFISIMLSACQHSNIGVIGGADGPTLIVVSEKGEDFMFEQITAEEAKKIMDSDAEYTILDVREEDEFAEGHIPGAILIPHTEIEDKAEEMLTDKEEIILVYCRSGRRSKLAAEAMARLGYKNVKEFGGIMDWPYEIEEGK